MIIRRENDSLLFITQPDHARLAAEIMSRWREGNLTAHPRRGAILRATTEHDNGWIEEDTLLHVDAGGEPQDFISVPPLIKHRIWPRATARLESEPYVAALIAQHALTVYGQQRTDPGWQAFFDGMDRIRGELLKRSGAAAADHLVADYPFVQLGDHLSLIFCNGWDASFPRPGGRTILKFDGSTTLEVTPDPFEGERVPLRVQARRLEARAYASAEDLREAYNRAPVITLAGEAAGSNP